MLQTICYCRQKSSIRNTFLILVQNQRCTENWCTLDTAHVSPPSSSTIQDKQIFKNLAALNNRLRPDNFYSRVTKRGKSSHPTRNLSACHHNQSSSKRPRPQQQIQLIGILDLVEGNNVTALDILIDGCLHEVVLNQTINGHEVIHNGQHDCHLLDTITNGHKLCCNIKVCQSQANLLASYDRDRQKFLTSSPSETLHLDTANSLLKLLHVSFIIPRLHVHQDRGLATCIYMYKHTNYAQLTKSGCSSGKIAH